MTIVTLIGAGSAEFTAGLVTDFLSVNTLADGEFRLVDIDPVTRSPCARRPTSA